MKLKLILLGVVLALLSPAMVAQAQQPSFHVILHDPLGTATPGVPGTISFHATLKNNGPTAVYINGASITLNAPSSHFTLDASKFYQNVPTVLAANSSWSGLVFDVLSSGSGALQEFFYGDLTVLGGVGPTQQDDMRELDSVHFAVAVVPEASGFVMFGAGLLGVGLLIRRRPGMLARLR